MLIAIGFCSCRGNRPVEIPISDFFQTPQKSLFKISPDGKYVSYFESNKDKQNLFIQSVADGKEQMATGFQGYSVRDYYWTYDNQIVFTQDLVAADEFKISAFRR